MDISGMERRQEIENELVEWGKNHRHKDLLIARAADIGMSAYHISRLMGISEGNALRALRNTSRSHHIRPRRTGEKAQTNVHED